MNIAIVAGIRSQFVKVAAFQHALQEFQRRYPHRMTAFFINAGQHYDFELAGTYIDELNVTFDLDLTTARLEARPIDVLCDMLVRLCDVFTDMRPQLDAVVVFGDANATLAGALAAARCGIPLIHVESGVRTGLRHTPEEQNRVVADHLAVLRLVSSKPDMNNLIAEGLSANSFWTGDLVYDLVKNMRASLSSSYAGHEPGSFVLATMHREENVASASIMQATIHTLAECNYPVVFSLHPRTRKRLQELDLMNSDNIEYMDGLPYEHMLTAINGCRFLFTDSGALQREAYYLGKRCLVRQDSAFWPVLIARGVHCRVGADRESMAEGFKWMEAALVSRYPRVKDFGYGHSGMAILRYIYRMLPTLQGGSEARLL